LIIYNERTEVVANFWKDPLVHHVATARWFAEATAAQQRILAQAAQLDVSTLVLLAGAGALGRSFVNLRRVEPGFDRQRVLTAQIIYPLFTNDFSNFTRLGPDWRRFYNQLSDAVATLPGVRSAGAVTALPLSGAWESTAFGIAGRPPAQQGPSAFFAGVSEGYFATLGIPLLKGRVFDATDRDSARSAIVSTALASKYFPGEDPIGQQIRVFGPAPLTIVGVVADVHQQDLARSAEPTLYLPMSAYPSPHMTLVVRSDTDPMGLVPAIQAQIRAINPAVPLTQPRAMEDVLGESLAQRIHIQHRR
jgi:putative ABC transport system permease protein